MIFLTTTAVDLDEELLNRCLVLTVDESREQTRRIHAQQRARYTLDGIAAATIKSDVLALHRAAQSLLKPYEVHIPWVDRLTFLDEKTRTRRDHMKYLQLIAAVALLHQYQREIRPVKCADGKTVPAVVATLDDIARANALAHETLGRCLDDMPPQTRRFLLLLDDMVAQRCAAKKIERADCLFRQRDARGFTGWSDFQVKTHLRKLVELEYVFARRDPEGLGLLYELAYDGAGKDGRRFLCGLFDVEKLRASHDYAEGREHQTVAREHGGSPAGALREHGGSIDENAQSPSENRAPDAKSGENAVPGGDDKDAAA